MGRRGRIVSHGRSTWRGPRLSWAYRHASPAPRVALSPRKEHTSVSHFAELSDGGTTIFFSGMPFRSHGLNTFYLLSTVESRPSRRGMPMARVTIFLCRLIMLALLIVLAATPVFATPITTASAAINGASTGVIAGDTAGPLEDCSLGVSPLDCQRASVIHGTLHAYAGEGWSPLDVAVVPGNGIAGFRDSRHLHFWLMARP
jgi:hypothetical protein